jgi:uncharacterized membrane protein YcaP (DUF421 family)
MWDNLMSFGVPPLNLILRASIVYFVILILLRISGKRQIGQMGATEFVAILLISNAVQNSMNGGDNSLIGGIVLAAVLICFSSAISFLTYRSRLAQAIFEGTPRLLIHEGKTLDAALQKELLSKSELKSMLRKQGVHAVHEVKTGILEADGTLSLVRFAELNGEHA